MLRALAVASATRARAAAGPADARRGRRARRRGRRLVRAVCAGEDARRDIEKLYGAVSAALTTAAASQAIAKQGMTLSLRTPAELAAWLPGEVAKWAGVIKARASSWSQ